MSSWNCSQPAGTLCSLPWCGQRHCFHEAGTGNKETDNAACSSGSASLWWRITVQRISLVAQAGSALLIQNRKGAGAGVDGELQRSTKKTVNPVH